MIHLLAGRNIQLQDPMNRHHCINSPQPSSTPRPAISPTPPLIPILIRPHHLLPPRPLIKITPIPQRKTHARRPLDPLPVRRKKARRPLGTSNVSPARNRCPTSLPQQKTDPRPVARRPALPLAPRVRHARLDALVAVVHHAPAAAERVDALARGVEGLAGSRAARPDGAGGGEGDAG